MSKKILLLNPPGKKLYIRDYYCSKVSKSSYLFHPVDLLMLSGRLAEKYDIEVIDAIADRLDVEKCLEMIEDISPDAVVSLIGAVSFEEDTSFLKKLADGSHKVIVTGDVSLENTVPWLKRYPFIDAVLLDFSSDEIVSYIEGEFGEFNTLAYRDGEDIIGIKTVRAKNEEFNLPIPRHELFSSKNYRFPFVRHKEFATLLTDYGCPFKCSFCVMSTLGYRYRNVENVIEELKYLKKLGKKELFVIDQTFAINKKRTHLMCERMIEENLGFGWVCYSRVDLINDELLRLMKSAGCHTIMFGVESASEEILKKYQKGYTKPQIKEAFELCQKYKVRTVATFILGLPDETMETANETVDFIKNINCDYVSFNVAVPRMNTSLRGEAIREGLIDEDFEVMDQTGSSIAMPTKHLTREEVYNLKKKAVKAFYLRPSYILGRLRKVRSFYELKEQVLEGLSMLRGL